MGGVGGGRRGDSDTGTMDLFIGPHARGSAAKKARPHSQKPSGAQPRPAKGTGKSLRPR